MRWWWSESVAWGDFLGGLDDERCLVELGLWAVSAGASCWIVDLTGLETVRIGGLVERLNISPVEGHVEALITDGTGRLVSRWGTRPPTPQVAVVPGRLVVVEGLVVVREDDKMIMLDPAFDIFPRSLLRNSR
jgi:hypothetical protein